MRCRTTRDRRAARRVTRDSIAGGERFLSVRKFVETFVATRGVRPQHLEIRKFVVTGARQQQRFLVFIGAIWLLAPHAELWFPPDPDCVFR